MPLERSVEVPYGNDLIERQSPLHLRATFVDDESRVVIGNASFRNLIGEDAYARYQNYLRPSRSLNLRERVMSKLGQLAGI